MHATKFGFMHATKFLLGCNSVHDFIGWAQSNLQGVPHILSTIGTDYILFLLSFCY